jgi:hypothetical protein
MDDESEATGRLTLKLLKDYPEAIEKCTLH